MRFRKFLLVSCGSLLLLGALAVFLTPLAVAGGLRLWIARAAQRDGLRITFEKIEAPLLSPVVVQKFQITSQPDAPFHVMVEAPRVELAFNFAAIFSQSRGRFLRSFVAEAIEMDIRRNPQPPPASQSFAWRIIEDLLADNFKLSGVELHFENGDTIVDLHNGTLSGAQIEAGVFSASDITIASPWFRKSFSQLRGVTSWQDSRLTVGALTLTRGLDLDAASIDLSHIGESRLGLEVALDAFGGKLRARISNEVRNDQQTWDAAGTASEVSLAQMSDALDLTDRASGSLHACKFTFRGEATNLLEAQATLWAEVTGLTWRDRTADSIMIGATLYNRQVHVEQLFVKQRNNQFTLSGESALPQKWSDWLNPDFAGDISASINDLGDFARLFGARPADFDGKIEVSGNVNAQERKLGGQLSASGNSLTLFRTPIESLRVELSLKESRLEISELELRRKNDSFHGQASLVLASDRGYSFTFTSSIADLAEYAALIPEPFKTLQFGGSLDLNCAGHGTVATHSGTFHAWGHGLHPQGSPVIPFDAEFEGDYSPDNILFRQFSLSNPHAAFNAFVTVAPDYFQLQALRLDLNGKPKLQGNICLPLSVSKLHSQGNWLAALSDDPDFDLDVALDPTDLAELAGAVTKWPKLSGQVSGSLEVRGKPPSPEGKSTVHLRDFVFANEPPLTADVEVRSALGTLNARAAATARGSDPANLEGSMPLRLEKQESGYALTTDGALSATLNFPVILLSKLPLYVSRRTFVDGILSGRLTIGDSLPHPQLRGSAQLVNGRLLGGMTLSTAITFEGQTATIDFAQVGRKSVHVAHALAATLYTARGEIDFRDLADIQMRVFPIEPVAAVTMLEPGDCVNEIELSLNGNAGLRRPRIDEIDFRGSVTTPDWTISLSEKTQPDPLETLLRAGPSRTFPVCHDFEPLGKTLTLGIARPSFP
jgi:hypothetical protein